MATRLTFWFLVGIAGQFMFSMRFLVQWIASERARRSVVPVHFWYFSVAGSVLLLAYAIFRRDPVFVVGESVALLIFLRNLTLIRGATAQ